MNSFKVEPNLDQISENIEKDFIIQKKENNNENNQ